MARILIVEDDDEIRELLSETLIRWGHETVLTANGQEGFNQYRNGSFELILSDIRMPIMDGLALLKSIREKDKKIPIVIITAFPTVDSAVESLGLGADHYLVKPVNFDDLKAKVNKCLEKGRIQGKVDQLQRLTVLQWILIPLALAAGYFLANIL
ncbi:response regulator [bacterium]|nr:response regulator [bacterium]